VRRKNFSAYDETSIETNKPAAQYRSNEVGFALNDTAIEGLMRLFGYMQVKFWLE
jgi:hypothetical protein